MNLTEQICKAFNRAAPDYQEAALLQTITGQQLIERLDYIKINPKYILDIGSGSGEFSFLLKKKYPQAVIVSLDLSYEMLIVAKKKQGWWTKLNLVNADMMALPFKNEQFDLVFSNQVIHWSPSLNLLFKEFNRVMRAEGCLLFSSLGPDTFKEIKQSWKMVDNYSHINEFLDMHDVGDSLLQAHFADPVMDMDMLVLHYERLDLLFKSLKKQGVRNISQARHNGLTGKKSWTSFCTNYQQFCTADKRYPLTYEVVYGHAWKVVRKLRDTSETLVPISSIKRSTHNPL